MSIARERRARHVRHARGAVSPRAVPLRRFARCRTVTPAPLHPHRYTISRPFAPFLHRLCIAARRCAPQRSSADFAFFLFFDAAPHRTSAGARRAAASPEPPRCARNPLIGKAFCLRRSCASQHVMLQASSDESGRIRAAQKMRAARRARSAPGGAPRIVPGTRRIRRPARRGVEPSPAAFASPLCHHTRIPTTQPHNRILLSCAAA